MRSPTTPIPRYRPVPGPALFSQGFRPFFLGAGLWALVVGGLSLPAIYGVLSIPTAFDPVAWHAHEMIFGFVSAAVAGFLLTTIPNWTGRLPLQGRPLAALFAIWLLGRLAVAVSAPAGAALAMVIDLLFPALLLAAVLYEIVAGRNWRNLPMAAALGGLLVANFLTHWDVVGEAATGAVGRRLGIAVIVLLISVVGGRIVPSFTRNWLAKRGAGRMPATFGPFDRACLGLASAALAAWTLDPGNPLVGAGLLAAGVASLVRLARWRGVGTAAEPLVWSLHLGFLWVPVGLVLVGLGVFRAEVPSTAGLHALTAGAMGAMTLAVMTRTALGHPGRPLVADRWTAAIYLLVNLAAACRVLAPFVTGAGLPLLWSSGLLWSAAFAIFSLRFGRMLASR